MSEEAAAVLCSWMHAWHGMLGVEMETPNTHIMDRNQVISVDTHT